MARSAKNIAIVIDSLSGGGAERVMLTLAQALIELGHRVTLLSLANYCDYPIPAKLKLVYLFDGKASKVDRLWNLKKNILKVELWFNDYQQQNGEFDLVLSNLDKSNNLLAMSQVGKVFYVIHNSVEEEILRQRKLGYFAHNYLVKSKARLNHKNLICVSNGIKNEILNHARIKPASIRTIYNPFDYSLIQQSAVEPNPQIPNSPYVIHVGRVARQKRHDILFQAFKEIDSNYQLVLLCNKPDKAVKLATKYGVADRLILPGFQKNPYNWIKNASALVLSSDYEGFGNVLCEALAVGTLAVSTQCPHGPDEILSDELTRFLAPRRDPAALAKALSLALKSEIDPTNSKILSQTEAHTIAQQYLALCD